MLCGGGSGGEHVANEVVVSRLGERKSEIITLVPLLIKPAKAPHFKFVVAFGFLLALLAIERGHFLS